MCLLSSVEFLECVCRNDAMWFLYLVLNSRDETVVVFLEMKL